MKSGKRIIGIVIAVILIILFVHPSWMPLPEVMKEELQELTQSHFLVKGSAAVTAARVLALIPALLTVWAVSGICSQLLAAVGKKNSRSETVTNLLRSLVRYLAVLVAVFWGLSILGVNTAAMLASVGIVGLVIGFGAQSLIEDIITGFFIIFEGEYNVGDIIILDDFRGVVRNIGVRTTIIEDTGGNLKIVNNSDIRNLQNRSRNSSLAVSDISVSYGTDIEAVRSLAASEFQNIYLKNQDVFLTVPRFMGLEAFGDSALVLRFCVDTREDDVFAARRRLNEAMLELFRKANIEIPFPQVVVHSAEQ